MENSRILVTGGTGLVGSHLLVELTRRGFSVVALRRASSDIQVVRNVFEHYGLVNLFDRVEWCQGDVTDRFSLMPLLDGVSAVYHTAAMVSFVKADHQQVWDVNVHGTANVVEAILASGSNIPLCLVSSIGAVGHTTDGSLIDENTPFQSDSERTVYSQSKFRQEMEVWQGVERGLDAVVVNPGVVLGPCADGRSSGLIVDTMSRGTRFYTEGSTGYVDARDVARAMVDLMEHRHFGQRFILVGANSTVRNLQNLMADRLGQNRPVTKAGKALLHIAASLLHIRSWFTGEYRSLTSESIGAMGGEREYSSQKVIDTIGMTFTQLEDAVDNMVAFHQKYNTKV